MLFHYKSVKSNLFSYSKRDQLCDYAYQSTRQHLINQKETIEPILHRHGMSLNLANLREKNRNINDFLEGKPAQSSWSNMLNESLDSLERSIRQQR